MVAINGIFQRRTPSCYCWRKAGFSRQPRKYCSNAGNAASRRTYRSDVVELRDSLLQECLLIEPTPVVVDQAWIAYSQGEPGGAGIVDLISFTIMRQRGISEAFTNDRHFKAAGFTTLF